MKEIKSHKDLLIWEKGIEITLSVYQLVQSFPKDEIYNLSNRKINNEHSIWYR
jgi:hypothetical protein